ncbi:energy transducer TonB [Campylobacter curvus]|uniref:energy transducer TonB n=1 Tax=Campylobacter curvus TaxID=200 RepID=UPI0003A81A05|nr:energy transducer TonB [Campylobacter curvus]QKF60694.1 energy transduction protein TonB [Campylobacter curvus]UEB49019.1 TonB family protein [Campylobacter curvus]
MLSQHSLNKVSNYSGLFASILLHAAALIFILHHPFEEIKPAENKSIKMALESFDMPQAKAEVSTAPEIAETLMIPEPTPPAPPPPPPPEVKPPEPKPIPPEPKPEPKPKPKKEPKPEPKPKPKPKPEPKKQEEVAQPQPTPPVQAPQPTQPATTTQTSSASSSMHNLPPNGANRAAAPVSKIGELNLANSAGDENFAKIVNAIKKHQKYPKNAQKMRHQGVVEVRFLLKQNGSVEDIKVIKSSGYSSLDDGAIENVERASQDFPTLNNSYYVSIPISFKLR